MSDRVPNTGSRTSGDGSTPRITVLVVEDDSLLRAALRRMISECGFAVLEAADGEAAERVVDGHRGAVDVLLADVIMPRSNGAELARRLLERHGVQPVLMSGLPREVLVKRGAVCGDDCVLEKPFTLAVLADALVAAARRGSRARGNETADVRRS